MVSSVMTASQSASLLEDLVTQVPCPTLVFLIFGSDWGGTRPSHLCSQRLLWPPGGHTLIDAQAEPCDPASMGPALLLQQQTAAWHGILPLSSDWGERQWHNSAEQFADWFY